MLYSIDLKSAIEPLLKSDIAKKVLGETIDNKSDKNKKKESKLPHFWTSQSTVLDIHKDDLFKLSKQDLNIRSIYENLSLRVPDLLEVRRLPTLVQENKGSAWGLEKIGALNSWGAYLTRGKGVKIALLDTGVDASHPDLRGKIKNWIEFDEHALEVSNSKPHDSDHHGTHCAGTIVGGDSSGKWIGVAPEAELAVALVLKKGKGTFGQILAGIDWAINQDVDVINILAV